MAKQKAMDVQTEDTDTKATVLIDETGLAPEQPANPSGKKATELLAYLQTSGTNPHKLESYERFAREHGKDFAADALYRHMEVMGMANGTLRKAGKWVFGDSFEPGSVSEGSDKDEIARVREECAQIKSRNQDLVAERNGYMNRAAYLQGQVEKLSAENAWLRMGKPAADLAALDAAKAAK